VELQDARELRGHTVSATIIATVIATAGHSPCYFRGGRGCATGGKDPNCPVRTTHQQQRPPCAPGVSPTVSPGVASLAVASPTGAPSPPVGHGEAAGVVGVGPGEAAGGRRKARQAGDVRLVGVGEASHANEAPPARRQEEPAACAAVAANGAGACRAGAGGRG